MTDPAEQTVPDYAKLLNADGPAALVLKQTLEGVEGKDAVVFPPTYAAPKDDSDKRPRYNIDEIAGGTLDLSLDAAGGEIKRSDLRLSSRRRLDAAIDSVGAQGNRVEPIFKLPRNGEHNDYSHLVPQVVIEHDGGPTDLLDAGHRAADAIVRFSTLMPNIHRAFLEYDKGNANPMAKLAVMSLVLGAWDSRMTQVKIPRLINMRIDARDVEKRTRSAQYNPATDYVLHGLIDEVDENTGADLGFAAVPSTGTLGGVVAKEIKRTCSLNLCTLRDLRACDDNGKDEKGEETRKLQEYILALCLVCLTLDKPQVFNLRQGCQLIVSDGKGVQQVGGNVDGLSFTHRQALDFAAKAAEAFGVSQETLTPTFDRPLANRMRALWADTSKAGKKKRDKLEAIARLRSLTMAEIDRFEASQGDPLKPINDKLKEAKQALGKKPTKTQPKVSKPEALQPAADAAQALADDDSLDDDVRDVARMIVAELSGTEDSHAAHKAADDLVKQFNKERKEAAKSDEEGE